jgi:DNA mismatch endonuclease (patch repair protein)
MADRVTSEIRSRMMRAVKGKDTKPELEVRRALHAAGFRFRLHRRDLSGRPDVVLPRFNVAVFVHGCFWHGHDCARGKRPSSNKTFWSKKIGSNIERDRRNIVALQDHGWTVFVLWQCGLANDLRKLIKSLQGRSSTRLKDLRN